MARINQDLLDRLSSKLGVTKGQAYKRVQQIASRTFLDRQLAALVVATENGINIHKYSTPEQRSQIRISLNSGALGGAQPDQVTNRPAPSPSKGAGIGKRAKLHKVKDNSVFVVHGRDEGLRKSVFEFLRALGLNPMEWSKAVLLPKKGGANPHVDDILDAAMGLVQAVVVLFSPDDLAMLRQSLVSKGEKNTEGKLQGQPRPNVIFEAGLALGRHPEKTLLVQVGKIRGFSDIAGKHMVRLANDVTKRKDVANRLGKIGCKVDLAGDDWMSAGDLAPKS